MHRHRVSTHCHIRTFSKSIASKKIVLPVPCQGPKIFFPRRQRGVWSVSFCPTGAIFHTVQDNSYASFYRFQRHYGATCHGTQFAVFAIYDILLFHKGDLYGQQKKRSPSARRSAACATQKAATAFHRETSCERHTSRSDEIDSIPARIPSRQRPLERLPSTADCATPKCVQRQRIECSTSEPHLRQNAPLCQNATPLSQQKPLIGLFPMHMKKVIHPKIGSRIPHSAGSPANCDIGNERPE